MREIKFKALIDMYSPTTQDIVPSVCVVEKMLWDTEHKIAVYVRGVWYSPIELMQYIGMKDKNVAEIYENDIVQFTAFGRTVIGVIEWDMDDGLPGFVIVDIDGSGTFWSFLYDDLAVIGNIYENPELLI